MITKEQYEAIHSIIVKHLDKKRNQDCIIDSNEDNYSNGYDEARSIIEKTLEEIGKKIEELEYYGFNKL